MNAIDDDIANDINVADMLTVFENMNAATMTLSTEANNLSEIVHMMFLVAKRVIYGCIS